MEKYEIHKFLEEYKKRLLDMYQALGIEKKEPELKKLNEEIQAPDFWSDQKHAQSVIMQSNALKDTVSSYNDGLLKFKDIEDMVDMALEDSEAMALLEESIEDFNESL